MYVLSVLPACLSQLRMIQCQSTGVYHLCFCAEHQPLALQGGTSRSGVSSFSLRGAGVVNILHTSMNTFPSRFPPAGGRAVTILQFQSCSSLYSSGWSCTWARIPSQSQSTVPFHHQSSPLPNWWEQGVIKHYFSLLLLPLPL